MRNLRVVLPAAALLASTMLAPHDASAQIEGKSKQYLQEATVSLYNFDYAQCRKSLRKIIAENPENPFGYLFEAGEIWWQLSNEYGLSLSSSPAEALFVSDVNAALAKSAPMRAAKDLKMRADGDFITGFALGLHGQWLLMQGHWIDAYFDGHKGLRFLHATLALDPHYYDADLGLGIYDYQAAKFGRRVKVGYVLRIFGSEKNGMRLISQAKELGRYAANQAAVFLLTIYIQDKHDYQDALPLTQELRRSFPQSPYLEAVEAMLDYNSGLKGESFKLGKDIYRQFENDPQTFEPKLLSMACAVNGDSCLNRRQMAYFADWINGCIEKYYSDKSQRDFLLTLRLLHGYCESVLGKKPQAEADYREVLAEPDFLDYHARAKKCLADGCDRDIVLGDLDNLAQR